MKPEEKKIMEANKIPKFKSPYFKQPEKVQEPGQQVSMEGVFQFMHLALLQQSVSLMNSFVPQQAADVYKNVYEGQRKRILDAHRGKPVPSLKWLENKASKKAHEEKKKFLDKMERMRSESAKHIERYLSGLDDSVKKHFENYSKELGFAALEMMEMPDPSQAKKLIQAHNNVLKGLDK